MHLLFLHDSFFATKGSRLYVDQMCWLLEYPCKPLRIAYLFTLIGVSHSILCVCVPTDVRIQPYVRTLTGGATNKLSASRTFSLERYVGA